MPKEVHELKYPCPFCDYMMTEEELEQVPDEGCPSCRRSFDIEDYFPEDNSLDAL